MVQDSLNKLFAILICVVMLFVVPTMLSYQRQDAISYNMVKIEVDRFSETVREVGYIDEPMLKKFYNVLDATGNQYSIELEHLKKVFSQESGEILVYYDGYYTSDIWDSFSSASRYEMSIGDFFYIRLTNTSKTKSQIINQLVGIKSGGPGIMMISGGIIRYGDT